MGGEGEVDGGEDGAVLTAGNAHRVARELRVRGCGEGDATVHDEVPLPVRVLDQTYRMGAEIALVVAATHVAPGYQLLADRANDRVRRHRRRGRQKHDRRGQDLVDARQGNQLVLGRARHGQLDSVGTQAREQICDDLAVVDELRTGYQLRTYHVAPFVIAHVDYRVGGGLFTSTLQNSIPACIPYTWGTFVLLRTHSTAKESNTQ